MSYSPVFGCPPVGPTPLTPASIRVCHPQACRVKNKYGFAELRIRRLVCPLSHANPCKRYSKAERIRAAGERNKVTTRAYFMCTYGA
eukprot:5051465-Prymnesium_polylepis.1